MTCLSSLVKVKSSYEDNREHKGYCVCQNIIQSEPEQPIRDSFQKVWHNMFTYISDNSRYFQYAEQFANSPYSLQVNKGDIETAFTLAWDAIKL